MPKVPNSASPNEGFPGEFTRTCRLCPEVSMSGGVSTSKLTRSPTYNPSSGCRITSSGEPGGSGVTRTVGVAAKAVEVVVGDETGVTLAVGSGNTSEVMVWQDMSARQRIKSRRRMDVL